MNVTFQRTRHCQVEQRGIAPSLSNLFRNQRLLKSGRFLLILIAMLGLSAGVFAQSITGALVVTVSDPSGASVPGAKLTLTQIDTGVKNLSESNTSGIAVYGDLKPGEYKLVVHAPGFQETQLNNISVVIGQRSALTATMHVGSVDTVVNVSAAAETLLNSESAAAGQAITKKSVEDLPLNGRNFVQLTQLTTGAAPVGVGTSPATTWTGRSDTTVSFVGLRESDTSYLVNGIETRNARFGNTGIRPSVDAIQEFRVQRSFFGADFGHSASVVNTTLLAGANPFHMVLFELNRNVDYAAVEYFAKQNHIKPPALNQNSFGSTFSGPVLVPHLYNGRDKTFFMFNYEGFRLIQGTTQSAVYPSVAQLQGNLADDSAGTGVFPTSSPFCLANPGSAKCVDIINPQTNTPFPGNVIPAGQISPFANAAIAGKFIPTPNVSVPSNATNFPVLNYSAAPRNTQTINQYNARIDHQLTSKDTVYGTWSDSNDNLHSPSVQPLGGLNTPLADRLWTATWVHVFTSNIFNEFRFGLNDSNTFTQSEAAYGPDYAGTVFGLPYANPNPATFGVPSIGIAGFGGVGSVSETIGADDRNLQLSDNVSVTHGKLTMTAGGQFMHEKFKQITDFGSNPSLSFNQGYSARLASGLDDSSFGLSDFLLGQPRQVTAASGNSDQLLHTNYYGVYSQNNWKVRPSLTLNLGLRYEFARSPIDSQNHAIYFDIPTGQFQYAGVNISRSIVNPDYNNFAPRVGFAWRPSFLSNTVIRGGVGTYYATDNFNELQFLIAGSPFYTSLSNSPDPLHPVSITNPFGGTSTAFPPANANIFTLYKNSRTPYVNQWDFSVQREFGGKYLVEVEYAGGSGQKLAQRYNANAGSFDPTGTVPLAQRIPFPQYGFILVSSNYGRSNYNGLEAKFEKRFSGGSSFLAAYTYSKAIDIGTTDDFSSLSRNFFTYDRGVSDYDVPQRLVLSYVYQLPFGRGRQFLGSTPAVVNALVSGWQLNGITVFSSGQFTTPGLSYDNLNIGAFSSSRPDKVGDPKAGRKGMQWFNPSAFAAPPGAPNNHVPGNAGRNSLELPGYQNWDASLFKAVQIHDRAQFQLRFEAFNAFNHTQFSGVATGYTPNVGGNGNFGVITSTRAGSARVIQLGGRFTF